MSGSSYLLYYYVTVAPWCCGFFAAFLCKIRQYIPSSYLFFYATVAPWDCLWNFCYFSVLRNQDLTFSPSVSICKAGEATFLGLDLRGTSITWVYLGTKEKVQDNAHLSLPRWYGSINELFRCTFAKIVERNK